MTNETKTRIKKLRAQHDAIMKHDNSLLQDAAIAVRKEIIKLANISEDHCQSCGSIVGQGCSNDGDGYSDCCNELIIHGRCDANHCFHLA